MRSASLLLVLVLAGGTVAESAADAQAVRVGPAGPVPAGPAGAVSGGVGAGGVASGAVSGGTNTQTLGSPETIGTDLTHGSPDASVDDGVTTGPNDTTYLPETSSQTPALDAQNSAMNQAARLPDGRLNGMIGSGPLDGQVGGSAGGMGPH
jgi:hypothetical protein